MAAVPPAPALDAQTLTAFAQMFKQVVTANQATAVASAVQAVQAAKSKESQPNEDLWDASLREAIVRPTTEGAEKIVSLLKKPPDLGRLEVTLKEVLHYKGLPEAAPARSHPHDKALHSIQQKPHAAICCFVDAKEHIEIATLGLPGSSGTPHLLPEVGQRVCPPLGRDVGWCPGPVQHDFEHISPILAKKACPGLGRVYSLEMRRQVGGTKTNQCCHHGKNTILS